VVGDEEADRLGWAVPPAPGSAQIPDHHQIDSEFNAVSTLHRADGGTTIGNPFSCSAVPED